MSIIKKTYLSIIAIFFVAVYNGFSAPKKGTASVEFFKACRNNDEKVVAKTLKKTPSLANATLTQEEWNEYVKFRYDYNKLNEKDFDKTFEKYVEDLGDDFYKTLIPLYEATNGINPIKTVEILLDAGADINAKVGKEEWTPLINASRNGQKELVELLVKRGANVKARLNTGDTALLFASLNGYTPIVEFLLANGANINEKNNIGIDSLIWASNNNKKEVVEFLLANGANINTKDSKGNTALAYATNNGHKEILELLLANGADVNTKFSNNWTALMHAAFNGYKDIAEMLIKKGAKIDEKETVAGFNALFLATENGHKEIVETLISNGADINSKSNDNKTALMVASANGKLEVIEFLANEGIDLDSKDNFNLNALMYAINYEHYDAVKFLLSMGAKVTDEDFIKVCKDGKIDFVRLLLENNKEFANAKDSKGITALMMACANGKKEIVNLLVDNNANINARDNKGFSAVLLAATNGHLDIVEFLVENDADFSIKIKGGGNAIVALTKEEHPEIAEFIKQKEAEKLAKKRYRAEDFYYKITDDGKGVHITGVVNGNAGVEVIIPATIEGFPVTEVKIISNYQGTLILSGFERPTNIKKIQFEGIVDCDLNLPNCRSLNFANCSFKNTTLTILKEWSGAYLDFHESRLNFSSTHVNIKKLVIQEGVTVLRGTFFGCRYLEEIVIPKTLRRIESVSFLNDEFESCGKIPMATQARLRQLGYKGDF